MTNNINVKVEHDKCVGCKACMSVCPINAICFETDEEGFEYPIIDKNRCIDCGKCLNVCPVFSIEKPMIDAPKCFSAWSKSDEIRDLSTSGGFFYELAKLFLDEKGVVIGARYSDDFKNIYHAEARDLKELKHLLGTKYAQSDMKGIFDVIENHLNCGRKVLFSGTPCQCAAVKQYLRNNKFHENLYAMDFVCYSIYSPMVYRKWLEDLESQENSKICRLRFKSKKFGWEKRYVEIEFENGKIKYQSDLKGEDLFILGIEDSDLYQRYSCYNCQFREEKHRNSDFTVGDFWGIKYQTEYDMFKGISFGMANTPRAVDLIKKLNKSMVIRKCEIFDIKRGNPNMVENPVLQLEKRNLFFDYLKSNSFSEALFMVIANRKNKVTSFYKEISKVVFDKNISTVKYIYYNYFCKNIVRKGASKLVPDKNAVISFGENSKLILEGFRNFNIGSNKLKNSKAESYLRLYRDAKVTLKHGADLYYGTTMEVGENAEFEAGYFSANTGTVIVVDYKMKFGEYVGFGRNNMVYDSDFHALHTMSGAVFNRPCETVIGSHVWITSNNLLLPGTNIGDNVVVGSRNTINHKVDSNSFVRDNKAIPFSGWWSERSNLKGETIVSDKKLIIVGYGAEGKEFCLKTKNSIYSIIDNHSNDEKTCTFAEFSKNHECISIDYAFVICSSKYFDELYQMVRSRYPEALIVANYQFM